MLVNIAQTTKTPKGFIAIWGQKNTKTGLMRRQTLLFKGRAFPSRYEARKAAKKAIASLPF